MEQLFTLGFYGHWLITGLLLMGIELLLFPGAFFLWVGLAALIVGCLSWLIDLSLLAQLLIFSPLALLITWLGKTFIKNTIQSDAPLLNKRQEQLIGQIITLSSPIIQGHAQIILGDSVWNIRGPNLDAGDKVIITKVEGNTLIVASHG